MAIAIVKDGKVVFARGYGIRKVGTEDSVDQDTLFAVASNSKSFTTAALAILIDEGKIDSWDDKVSKYLPELQLYDPYVTEHLTIRDLVSHRVGLATFSGDLLWYETTYSSEEILHRAKHLKPARGFRTGFGYQNLMFIAAGKIIETVSGKSWSKFVTERLLKPLKMTRTTTSVDDLKENAAWPHNESGGQGLRALTHRGNVDSAVAAAGLNSSVREMAHWLIMQLGEGQFEGRRIVSAENIWEMHQPAVILPIARHSSRFIPSRHFNTFGLGWNVWDYHGRKVVSHSGGLDGMISVTAMMPEEKLGLVILTNSEQSLPTVLQHKIFDTFCGAPERDWSAEFLSFARARNPVARPEKGKAAPDLELANYLGTYSGELYGDAIITLEHDKPVLRLKPAPNLVADLEPLNQETFRIKWRSSVSYHFPPGKVVFSFDADGKPSGLEIDQPNRDFWFYELEFQKAKKK